VAREYMGITETRRAVLRLVCEGKSNNEIGAALGKSPLTVKNQIVELLKHYGVGNRLMIAVAAIKGGDVAPDDIEFS
jgi:DNA-binding NarL/FixJ family response regulator